MAKKKGETQRIAYIGNGAYRIGVPARDLTMEEWEDLPEAEREACLRLGLYQEEFAGQTPNEFGSAKLDLEGSSPSGEERSAGSQLEAAPDEPAWPLVLTNDDEDAESVKESEK